MGPTEALKVPVLTAERGSGARPSEDRIFLTDRAVIVLDGASQPEPSDHNGAWIADQIGADLAHQLGDRPDDDLASLLEGSIRHVAERHRLNPGTAPSTTVTIVRWNATAVDVLVLGDSPVVAADRQGEIRQVRDDRLAQAGTGLTRPSGFAADDPDGWRTLVDGQRRRRNRPDGYWIAEAAPEAAHHAIRTRWPIHDLAIVLAMTDGVSKGIDQYHVPPDWPSAIALAANDPAELLDTVHTAETSDPDGHRWPRSKRHDDKAIAVLRFDLAT